MKKRINRFLRALLCLFIPLREPTHSEKSQFKRSTFTMTQRQCLHFIDSVGRILKEEAAKKGMQVHIHIIPSRGVNFSKKKEEAGEMHPDNILLDRHNGSP